MATPIRKQGKAGNQEQKISVIKSVHTRETADRLMRKRRHRRKRGAFLGDFHDLWPQSKKVTFTPKRNALAPPEVCCNSGQN